MPPKRIVVVGCGVAGLTTALLLSKNAEYEITVTAKHMPGDYDIEYASPWAGANYLPVSAPKTKAASHDANTWPELERLAKYHPEAGIHFQKVERYVRTVDLENAAHNQDTRAARYIKADSWFKDIVPNFRNLDPSELPPGYSTGTTFTSVCIDTALYLPWLKSRCLASGRVRFTRSNLSHIASATHTHSSGLPADVIVNCTGLSSRTLGGVMDSTLRPARGQTVLVRNITAEEGQGGGGLMCDSSGTDDGDDEVCYVMQRPAGGGTLLGGSYQVDKWDSVPDPNLSLRIMKRAVELCPSLLLSSSSSSSTKTSTTNTSGGGRVGVEGLDVIRAGVGLRPVREGGVRLEKERLQLNKKEDVGLNDDDNNVWVVHNYGHGGYGYQSSYGCAGVAVELVKEALSEQKKKELKAKL